VAGAQVRLIQARDAEERARLEALRDAVRVGIADVEEGRVRTFRSPSAVERHLSSLADAAIGRGTARRRAK
jgi:antitoxin ParD1/3/4